MYNCHRLTAFDFIKDVCRTLRHKREILQYVGGVVEETDNMTRVNTGRAWCWLDI